MKVLVTINSKSPNKILYMCVAALYKIQIDETHTYKVCIVDSDSDDTSEYDVVKSVFPDIEIHFVKNKNYDYGAWKYAQTIYPMYDIYFCIQDSIIIRKKIDLNLVDDTNVYSFHHHSGYLYEKANIERGKESVRNSGLTNYEHLLDTLFNLATHNSFIVTNKIIKDIYLTFQNPPIDHIGTRMYERNFGLYFITKNINSINLGDYCMKHHCNRV